MSAARTESDEIEKLRTQLRRYENVVGRLLVSDELSETSVAQLLRVVRRNGVGLGVDHDGRISYTTYGLAEALGMDREQGYDVIASWRRRGHGPAYTKGPGGKQCRVRYPVEFVWDWVLANRVDTDTAAEISADIEAVLGLEFLPMSELGREFVDAAHLQRFARVAKRALDRRRGSADLREAS